MNQELTIYNLLISYLNLVGYSLIAGYLSILGLSWIFPKIIEFKKKSVLGAALVFAAILLLKSKA